LFMDHVFIIKTLPGLTHAERADAIGHGCKDYHVRDWTRRRAIPSEWWEAVAAAHPAGAEDTLKQLVSTAHKRKRPEPQSEAVSNDRRKAERRKAVTQ
jgi:hypothetical protein